MQEKIASESATSSLDTALTEAQFSKKDGPLSEMPSEENTPVLWFGAIVPLVGLLLAVVGMLTTPTSLGVLFIAIDAIIIACCFILLFRKG